MSNHSINTARFAGSDPTAARLVRLCRSLGMLMEPSEIQETRTVIIGLLELISNIEEQLEYQKTVPIANVPAELVCQWFDDFNPTSSCYFSECFEQSEQNAILAFHRFYESRLDDLPDTYDVRELHKSNTWLAVVDFAKKTLYELTRHA